MPKPKQRYPLQPMGWRIRTMDSNHELPQVIRKKKCTSTTSEEKQKQPILVTYHGRIRMLMNISGREYFSSHTVPRLYHNTL